MSTQPSDPPPAEPETTPDPWGSDPHPVAWRWWDAIVVYVVWTFLAAGIVAGGFDVSDPGQLGLFTAVSALLMVVVTVGWILARVGPRATLAVLGRRAVKIRDVLWSLVHGVIAYVVVTFGVGVALVWLVESLDRQVPPVQEGLQEAIQGGEVYGAVAIVSAVVLAPLGEELLYRGVLLRALHRRLPAWPAIGVSALVWAATHFEPFVVVSVFPLGLYLGWLQVRHGTLVVPVLVHALFNGTTVLLLRSGVMAG